MRIFVSVDLSSAAGQAVDELRRELARHTAFSASAIRWVQRFQLHVTLQFLGDLAAADLPAVVGVLSQEFGQRSFPVVLEEAGAFPERGVPRVIWLGARRGSEALNALRDDVTGRLQRCGVACDMRPFRPHVTIGRVKRASRSDGSSMRAVLWGLRPDVPPWVVDHVALYEARLSPQGSTYRVLASAPLAPE
jgi:2'-5' RNA ligase